MAQVPAYAFSDFFASQDLSDLTVRLSAADEDEVPQPPSKKQRGGKKKAPAPTPPPGCMDLPGHTMVLAGCSPVFMAQLTRWQEQPPSERSTHPVITLYVDSPEQLEAARAVVEYMYKQEVPNGAAQQLLVSMLQLADKYDVQACAAACCTALSQQDLEWDTVLQVLQLPPAYEESPLFSAMFSNAGDQLQQQLGDLEVAWASSEGRERFLALPLKGVELLLSDQRTRVAYENTVLVAVTLWVQQHSDIVTAKGKKRLAQLIRLPYVTPLFASGVVMLLPWLVEALSMATVAASVGASAAECSRCETEQVQLSKATSSLKWPVSWGLGRRPASERQGLCLTWHVPLNELGKTFEGHTSSRSPSASFGGYEWSMLLMHCSSANSSSVQLDAAGGPAKGTLGLYAVPVIPEALPLPPPAKVPVVVAEGSLVCVPPAQGALAAAAKHCRAFSNSGPFAARANGRWGWRDFWGTGGMAQWEPLRFGNWVDSDRKLTLQLNVGKFL